MPSCGDNCQNVGSGLAHELAFHPIQSCYQVPTTYKALNQVLGVIKRMRPSFCFEKLILRYVRAVILSFSLHQNHLDGLLKQFFVPTKMVSDSIDLRWGSKMCISLVFPSDMDAIVQRPDHGNCCDRLFRGPESLSSCH